MAFSYEIARLDRTELGMKCTLPAGRRAILLDLGMIERTAAPLDWCGLRRRGRRKLRPAWLRQHLFQQRNLPSVIDRMLSHALEEPVEIVGPARDRGLKTLVA